MCSQSTSSKHLHVFFAILVGAFFTQQLLKSTSCLATTSRCSCAAAFSTLVRSSRTIECFLLVPCFWGCSFFTTKSSPRGAGIGFTCSVERMCCGWSALLQNGHKKNVRECFCNKEHHV